MECIDNEKKKKPSKGEKFYTGFRAEILISADEFSVKDNCGGIPEDVAKNYAFKMGRDDAYTNDKDLETVGVYGIGMKRAFFKIGNESTVISHHDDSIFQVTVPSDWPSTPEWLFDFKKLLKKDVSTLLPQNGTYLKVTKIHPNIKKRFGDKVGFLTNLKSKLNEHYGYIIDQGFEIKLNSSVIKPLHIKVISEEPAKNSKKAIMPYVYNGTIDGVSIEVIVGFYRPPAKADELEKGLEGSYADSTSENAGVTVLCNDRIVLYGNKDHLTGWGDKPVPSYHTQFINVMGVVFFRSNTPVKLPVTTTKRGLDTSSAVYSTARNKIKEGLKLFTQFTNLWKEPTEERAHLFKRAHTINALVPGKTKTVFKLQKAKKGSDGEYQIPDLPKPAVIKKDNAVNIVFKRDKVRVEEMQEYFFPEEDKTPSEIGAWCFDELYSQIEK